MAGISGSVRVKVVPSPTLLSTPIFPPCISARYLAMASPSPVPAFRWPDGLLPR